MGERFPRAESSRFSHWSRRPPLQLTEYVDEYYNLLLANSQKKEKITKGIEMSILDAFFL